MRPSIRIGLLCLSLLCPAALGGCGATTPTSGPAPPPPPRESGIGAYGRPAAPATAAAVEALLRGYFRSLSEADGKAACRSLAVSTRAQLAGLGDRDGSGSGCVRQIVALFGGRPAASRRALREVEIESIRVSGRHGFVIYRLPGEPAEFLPLQEESGSWRVIGIGGTRLPSG
jgi:hypothetical protein